VLQAKGEAIATFMQTKLTLVTKLNLGMLKDHFFLIVPGKSHTHQLEMPERRYTSHELAGPKMLGVVI